MKNIDGKKHKQTPHIHGFLDKSKSETYIDNKISERMQCMMYEACKFEPISMGF